MNYICMECGMLVSTSITEPKCECGGLFSLDFIPPPFSLDKIDKNSWNIFRYREFMAIEGESWKEITLGEGMTPIINFDEDLMLKMDYMMPTLSFKDRGAVVVISHCKELGVNAVVQDSSGNAGNSIAAYGGRANVSCEIFVPEGTSAKKISMIESHGAKVNVVSGTRDDCANTCRQKVYDEGIFYANHVFSPFFYEGTKTYIYEIYEQLGRIPQNLFVPLGNGTLFIGMVKALEHLIDSQIIKKMPKLYAVQSENCDPFIKAFAKKSPLPIKGNIKPTLAEGIAVGEPMRGKEILEYIYKYDVELISIPEERIIQAQTILAEKGIFCELTTAATYAAYLAYTQKKEKLSDTLIPICGAGLKSTK